MRAIAHQDDPGSPKGLRVVDHTREPLRGAQRLALHALLHRCGLTDDAPAAGAWLYRFDAASDALWTLRRRGEPVASVALEGPSPGTRRALLRWWCVAPEARGQGLGRALLQRALHRLAQGLPAARELVVVLPVAKAGVAEALMDSFGFVPLGPWRGAPARRAWRWRIASRGPSAGTDP